MRARRLLAPVAVAGALFAVGTAAGAGVTGTLSGTTKLPAAGKGVAYVRALNLETGVVSAATRVGPNGSFRLSVPAGVYAFVGTTVSFTGKPVLEQSTKFMRVSAGGRHRLKVPFTRRPKKHRGPRAVAARPGFVDVSYPAVWIKHFDVSQAGPENSALSAGMADMLVTDLSSTLYPACHGVVVDRYRMWEVLAEQRLQQDPHFDPSTRVQTGQMTNENTTVTGSLAVSGTSMTATATVTDLRTGRTKTVTHTGPADEIFDLEQSLVPDLTKAICDQTGPPARYTGTVSGTSASTLTNFTIKWSGNVELTYDSTQQGGQAGEPMGNYAWYTVTGGSMHVTLDGSDSSCTYHGETDVAVSAPSPSSSVQLDADPASYFLLGGFDPQASIPVTASGSGCSDTTYPLTGLAFLSTGAQQTTGTALTGTASSQDSTSSSTWSWSLSPSG